VRTFLSSTKGYFDIRFSLVKHGFPSPTETFGDDVPSPRAPLGLNKSPRGEGRSTAEMTEGAGKTKGAGRTESDDLAGLLARATDDVIPVDQGDTRRQCPADGAVLLSGQPDRLDNVVR